MLAKIKRALSEKTLRAEDMLEALNREILPVLRAIRDAINREIGDEISITLSYGGFQATGIGTSYSNVDMAAVDGFGVTLDTDLFDTEDSGRTRSFYFNVVGYMDGASTSVSFQLYDVTDAAAVAGTEFTTSSATPARSGALGPLSLVDGHAYRVQTKRADGTAQAVVVEAEVLVRYE